MVKYKNKLMTPHTTGEKKASEYGVKICDKKDLCKDGNCDNCPDNYFEKVQM